MNIDKGTHEMSPILAGVVIGDLDMTPADQRSEP